MESHKTSGTECDVCIFSVTAEVVEDDFGSFLPSTMKVVELLQKVTMDYEKQQELRTAFEAFELWCENARVKRHELRSAFAAFKIMCKDARVARHEELRTAFEAFQLWCENVRVTRHEELRTAFEAFQLWCENVRVTRHELRSAFAAFKIMCKDARVARHEELRTAFEALQLWCEDARVTRHELRSAFAAFKIMCKDARVARHEELRTAFEAFQLGCENARLTWHELRSAFAAFKFSCQHMRAEKLGQGTLEMICRESEEPADARAEDDSINDDSIEMNMIESIRIESNWTNSTLKSVRYWLALGAVITCSHIPKVEATLTGGWSGWWTFSPATVTFDKLKNCDDNSVCAKPLAVPTGVYFKANGLPEGMELNKKTGELHGPASLDENAEIFVVAVLPGSWYDGRVFEQSIAVQKDDALVEAAKTKRAEEARIKRAEEARIKREEDASIQRKVKDAVASVSSAVIGAAACYAVLM